MHKKPSGDRGPVTLTGFGVRWEKVEHPSTKEALEQFYFDVFLTALRGTGLRDVCGKQNEENHFDFTLTTQNKTTYVDMAEFIIAEGKGSPYQDESPKYELSQYIDAVQKVIEKKTAKYRSHSSVPIQLLFYPTHWGFTLAEPIIDLIRHEIRSMSHIFNAIYFLQPLGDNEGILYMLYPAQVSLSEKDLIAMQSNIAIPLSPSAWRVSTE